MLKALRRKNSDHRGILVFLSETNEAKTFWSFNVWLKEETVKKAFEENLIARNPLDVQLTLRTCKQIIKDWNKDWNVNIFKWIEKAELKIAYLED